MSAYLALSVRRGRRRTMKSSFSMRRQPALGVGEHPVVEPEGHQRRAGDRARRCATWRGKSMAWAWSIISVHTGKRLCAEARRHVAPGPGHLELVLAGWRSRRRRPPASGRPDHVAARDVEVAGEAHEGGRGPLVLHAVGVVDHGRGTRLMAAGLVVA